MAGSAPPDTDAIRDTVGLAAGASACGSEDRDLAEEIAATTSAADEFNLDHPKG
jgi:hypothetical protein